MRVSINQGKITGSVIKQDDKYLYVQPDQRNDGVIYKVSRRYAIPLKHKPPLSLIDIIVGLAIIAMNAVPFLLLYIFIINL